MRKTFAQLLLMFSMLTCSYAQHTTVTATGITDSDGTLWTNGTVSVTFQPNPAQTNLSSYKLCSSGANLSPTVLNQSPVSLGSNGSFSLTVYDNSLVCPQGSQYQFTICPNASSKCGIINLPVTGTSIDITSQIETIIPAPRFPDVVGNYGYSDVEAMLSLTPGGLYYNVNNLCYRAYNGSIWDCVTGQPISVPVSITQGGTGATTASAALANLNGISSVLTTPQTIASNLFVTGTGLSTFAGPVAVSGILTVGTGLTVDGQITNVSLNTAGYVTNTSAGAFGTVATIPVSGGGTGATTAAEALTNLGGVSLLDTATQTIAGALNTAAINSIVNAAAYSSGSSTGGIIEAYAACPSTGCEIDLSEPITISTPQILVPVAGKPFKLKFAGNSIICTITSGACLTIASGANYGAPRTNYEIDGGGGTITYGGSSAGVIGLQIGNSTYIMTNVYVHGLGINNFSGSGSYGFYIYSWEEGALYDMTYGGNQTAIGSTPSGNNAQINMFNNWIDGNVNAVNLLISNLEFVGNTIQSNTGTTPFVLSGSNNHIAGNHFENNTDGTSATQQLVLSYSGTMQHILIEDNVFNSCAGSSSCYGGYIYAWTGSGSLAYITFKDNEYNSTASMQTGFSSGVTRIIVENDAFPQFNSGVNSQVAFAGSGGAQGFSYCPSASFDCWIDYVLNGTRYFADYTSSVVPLTLTSTTATLAVPVAGTSAHFTGNLQVDGTSTIYYGAAGITVPAGNGIVLQGSGIIYQPASPAVNQWETYDSGGGWFLRDLVDGNTAFTCSYGTPGTCSFPYYTLSVPRLNSYGNVTSIALSTPVNGTFTTVATGGTLAASTSYCAVITAVGSNGGHTAPSTESCITTDSGGNTNTVTYAWGTVPGAVSYNIYCRTTSAELLCANVAAPAVSWTDTGAITPSGAIPAGNTTLGGFTGGIITGTTFVDSGLTTAGYVTNTSAGVFGTVATIPNSALAVQPANTVLGALTATSPSSLPMPNCGSINQSLIWSSGLGFGCHSAPLQATGLVSLTSGTAVVSTAYACTPAASSCTYKLTSCGAAGSVLGARLDAPASGVVLGTSFTINALSTANTVVTTDTSSICWQIN